MNNSKDSYVTCNGQKVWNEYIYVLHIMYI